MAKDWWSVAALKKKIAQHLLKSNKISREDYVFHERRCSKIRKPRDWTWILQIDDGIDPCEEIQRRSYKLWLFIKMTAKKRTWGCLSGQEGSWNFVKQRWGQSSTIFSQQTDSAASPQLHFDSLGHTNRGWNSTPALSIGSHLISSRFNLAQYTSGQSPRQTA